MTFLINLRRIVPLILLGAALFVTPAHATFPGKNGRIAFILGPDVYTMNPDGSGVKQLTNLGERGAFWESWSPDGKQIVFNVFSPPNFVAEIWLMNADGSNQHLVLKEDNFRDERPSFTPDGQSLLFSRCNVQIEECAIYKVALDGRGLTQLTKYELGIVDLSPVLSPDDQMLVFNGNGHEGFLRHYTPESTAAHHCGKSRPLSRKTNCRTGLQMERRSPFPVIVAIRKMRRFGQ
jgi:TolB protein